MTPKIKEKLASEIWDFLKLHDLQNDVCIFYNNKRLSLEGIEENINPADYFEYSSGYISMSFEGDLYHILNYSYIEYSDEIIEMFDNLLKNYGVYYELGDSWNLSVYDL